MGKQVPPTTVSTDENGIEGKLEAPSSPLWRLVLYGDGVVSVKVSPIPLEYATESGVIYFTVYNLFLLRKSKYRCDLKSRYGMDD